MSDRKKSPQKYLAEFSLNPIETAGFLADKRIITS
jgi:hypothetical protein